MKTGWMSIFFARLSTHHWMVGYKTRTRLSFQTLLKIIILWYGKCCCNKNHHLQFEFLLNVQECSMVVQFLEHLPWQDLNTYQYRFWVFHHIRISFFASISFAASSSFAIFSKKRSYEKLHSFCYIASMFSNENESDKFWLTQKTLVHFQALATVWLVSFH